MGVLDFLFQGKPPPSTTTYGTSVSNIPQFMTDYTLGLLNKASAVAGEPYQAYGGPRLAQFTPQQQQAFQQTSAAQGQFMPAVQSGMNLTQQSGNVNIPGAAQPYMATSGMAAPNVAGGYINPYMVPAVSNIGAQTTPYVQAGSLMAPDVQQAYMNPYTSSVVNRIGELAGRNLRENLMPAINANFIRAGQFGSRGQQEAIGRTLRDVQESALAQQAQALSSGYGQAQQAAQADLARQLQAGQLAQSGAINQAQLLQSGYGGALTAAQADLARQAQLAQLAGNLAQQQSQAQLAAGQQLGNLGQLGQTMTQKDIAALEAAGQAQQQQQQKNLDLAYQDFLAQRAYPQQQLSMLNALIRGLPYSQTVDTSSTGPASTYQPSPLSQLLGGYALMNTFKVKKGGYIKRNPNRRSTRGKGRR